MVKILLSVLLTLFPLFLSAQTTLLNDDTKTPLTISDRVSHFMDTTAALSLEEVQQRRFERIGQGNFRVPFSDDVHWYRCDIRNQTARPKTWYIEWEIPVVELVQCYLVRPDQTKRVGRGGTLVEKSERQYFGETPYFALELRPGQMYTVYLRVESQRGHRVNVNLYDSASLRATELSNASTVAFISGLVFLRLFFVLLLAIFVVREKAFRAYGFMLVLRSLAYWGIISELGQILTTDPALANTINFVSYHLVPLGYVLVVRALLPSERLPAFVHHVLNVIVAAVVLLGAAIAVDHRWYWLLASQYLVLFSQLFIFGLYLYAIARKIPINWYYSVPFLLGVGSYFILVAAAVGVMNAPWVYGLAYLLFVSEIFVFGLFLGKIIIDFRRQREAAKRALLLQENQATHLKELDLLKTNFFANISHEFRTPLTLLTGPLEDFRQQYPANVLIPVMQRNVRRLQTLIEQLLDLSRLEAGQLRPAMVYSDLGIFLRQLFAAFESLAQSRHLVFNYQQNAVSHQACFDPDKLEKVVTNLLSNAFKFTPENGRVTVQADFSEIELNLEIRDYGIGIEAARLPHIFDRFYRIEPAGKALTEGAGIGLSLVHELVKTMRGEIRVESEPDRGTVFYLKLPIDRVTWAEHLTGETSEPSLAPALLFSAEAPTEQGSDSPSERPGDEEVPLLLIVEDNPDLRAYTRHIFQDDYRTAEGTDGQDGLNQAFELIPDLVVCDVMMPRLDGHGFCQKLKSDPRTSHIPVVMLTARAGLDDRLQGLELGADDYLTKPFNRDELLLRVRNLLKQRDVLRQKYSQRMSVATSDPAALDLDAPPYSLDDKFLDRAVRAVREQGGDSNLGVEGLCDTLHVSRSNLHRKLKALTGQSTTEFIRSIRVYRAAELLRERPKASVTEVAYEVGFDNPNYFSRAFSEQMGVPPSDWATTKSE